MVRDHSLSSAVRLHACSATLSFWLHAVGHVDVVNVQPSRQKSPCLHAIDESIHLEVHNSNIRFQQNYCLLSVVVNVERIQIDSYVMANTVDIGQAFTIQRKIEMKKLPSQSSN